MNPQAEKSTTIAEPSSRLGTHSYLPATSIIIDAISGETQSASIIESRFHLINLYSFVHNRLKYQRLKSRRKQVKECRTTTLKRKRNPYKRSTYLYKVLENYTDWLHVLNTIP
ncbi:hypothetical protein C0J52_01454 [Blattella germanica]|nr:hypothetical protein C0J52_01454 [Blattella germanica]